MNKPSEWNFRNHRRVLSFPAVHPCEAISHEQLLHSLVTLSRRICTQRKNFFVQRRNSREAIRQVGVLLVFLEEIQAHGAALSESAALSFSELHLTFQQILFLVDDCSREDAKLWILMKSEFIATQYRMLIRAIATSLDVFMASSNEISGEAKEIASLVAKQARNVKIDVDFGDEQAANQLGQILKLFEQGIEPEPGLIFSVLDYLEIKDWSDCNRQIDFLTAEIDLEHTVCEERVVSTLVSLLGFICYSRGSLFKTWEYDSISACESILKPDTPNFLTPEHFRCPITLELMTDPVTVVTGQTYDRSSITQWLETGNSVCPVTGERLKNKDLVPNTAIKKLILRFSGDNDISMSKLRARSHDMAKTASPGNAAFAGAMKCLSRSLGRQVTTGSDEEKQKAVYEIKLLVKRNVFIRKCLVKAGTVSPLLRILSLSRESSEKENAMFALMKLSKHVSGKKAIFKAGVAPIVEALGSCSRMELRQIAAAAIFYLSSAGSYRKLLGQTPRVIENLIELLKTGTKAGRKNALCAVFGLALLSDNKVRFIEAGLVPILVNVLFDSSDKFEHEIELVAALGVMAGTVEGASQMLQASALPAIAEIFRSSTLEGVGEVCVSILLSLCENGGDEAVASLARETPVFGALYSLVLQGTSGARQQARTLIDLMQEYHKLQGNKGF